VPVAARHKKNSFRLTTSTMTAQSIENNLDVAGRDYISGYASTIFQRVSRYCAQIVIAVRHYSGFAHTS
jgi:hypothetical protein